MLIDPLYVGFSLGVVIYSSGQIARSLTKARRVRLLQKELLLEKHDTAESIKLGEIVRAPLNELILSAYFADLTTISFSRVVAGILSLAIIVMGILSFYSYWAHPFALLSSFVLVNRIEKVDQALAA